MKKHGIQLQSGDFVLTIMTLVLVIFGVIMVFSSSYYSSINEGGTPYSYLIRDIIWATAGFAFMMLLTVVDYRFYKKIALPDHNKHRTFGIGAYSRGNRDQQCVKMD